MFSEQRIDDLIYETDAGREYRSGGVLHRLDGPAIERSDGDDRWFIHGEELSETEFKIYKDGFPHVSVAKALAQFADDETELHAQKTLAKGLLDGDEFSLDWVVRAIGERHG